MQVGDATGDNSGLNIVVERGGRYRTRTMLLPVLEDEQLPRLAVLRMTATDFERDDRSLLPRHQVQAWATVQRDGRRVLVHVCVDPRLGEVGNLLRAAP